MGSQNDSVKSVKMTLPRCQPERIQMTLLKGSSWGQENDSFEGVNNSVQIRIQIIFICNLRMMQEASKRRNKIKLTLLSFVSKLFYLKCLYETKFCPTFS